MKKFIFYPILLLLITVCSVPLSGKSTLQNNYTINDQEVNQQVPVIIAYTYYLSLKEGETAHMECRVEPIGDPTLKYEIYFNEKPLPNSSRYKVDFNFGFLSLDIKGLVKEDSGVYTFRFTNSFGSTSTSCTLIVE